jgi:solute carrier family 35 protein E3
MQQSSSIIMAEGSEERPPSISSSLTEADTLEDNERHGTPSPERSFAKLKTPDELDIGDDVERAELLPQEGEKPAAAPDNSTRTAVIWMVVNTLATIGIVRSSGLCLGIGNHLS